jgi:restriction system protein
MAVWLVRAGKYGQFEEKFIDGNNIYVTWDALNVNLSKLPDRAALVDEMIERYADAKPKTILNWASQVWPFAHAMQKGDLIIMPLKSQPAIQIGEITGDYVFEKKGPDPFFHSRKVRWIGEAIPRTNFGQDLLYTFGAFLTICRVRRNNAEQRINAMRENGWRPEKIVDAIRAIPAEADDSTGDTDIGALAQDQIGRLIAARFKGHDLTRLVEAILKAQGYTTYLSPEGPDGGVDILAGAGPLGFDRPRLCVEVKSLSSPVDRPTVDKLLGAVSKFQADQGLFVSWSGFKSNVQKELAASFFKVRLWGQKEILDYLFAHYDHLDDDIKAELPLKRIWTVAAQEADSAQ